MLTRHDETLTLGEYVTFRNLGNMNGKRKTDIYEVYSKDGDILLGAISWFGRWRKYAFSPEPGTVYEETCMRDIAQFVEEETKAYRGRPKGVKP